jgi:hypothetical protein
LADFFLVGQEFRALTGRPIKGGKYLNPDTIVRTLAYIADPGETAYWDAVRIKGDFLERLGKGVAGASRMSPRSEALWNYKTALRYRDEKAAAKYLYEFAALAAAEGLSAKDARNALLQSLRTMDPLYGIPSARKTILSPGSRQGSSRL